MQTFRLTGWSLILLGSAFLTVFAVYIGDRSILAPMAEAYGLNGMGFYLAATVGSAIIGWGYILIKAASNPELRVPVGVGSALGFVALSVMRLWAVLSNDPAFEPFAGLLPGEVLILFVAAIALLQASVNVGGRLKDAFLSFRKAPMWVQMWVNFLLSPVNIAAFVIYGMTQHPLAGWAALGFTFVLISNMAVLIYERGVSKLTSVPHLLPWLPMQIYTGMWLFVWGGMSPLVTQFAWAYFIIIGISNIFDVYDSLRWLRGEREVMA